jgi:hypothetical protein
METRELYLKMADYIEEHGFSPEYRSQSELNSECGCFLRALTKVDRDHDWRIPALLSVIGTGSFGASWLVSGGWLEDEASTRDAAAACRIAADLVTP